MVLKEVFNSTEFLILFTLLTFWGFSYLRAKTKSSLINIIVLSTLIIVIYLKIFSIPYEVYEKAGNLISYWLQPAVVCLAIPFYHQWKKIKAQFIPVIISQIIGSIIGIISGIYLALLFGANKTVALSLAAKSVTMPIALEVSQSLNAIPSITVLAVIIAGTTGQLIGFWFLRKAHITNPISQALGQGTSSHALGVVACLEIGQKYAAYATLGLIFNGILTSFLAPYIIPLIL